MGRVISQAHEDISGWGARIEAVIAATDHCCVDRVVVIGSTPSTMDAALLMARGHPGLLLIASSQTAGRGARGRRWHDGDRCTLPCTFVIDPAGKDAPTLAACVACAVHETLNGLLPAPVEAGIKWPNDIVVRHEGRERKLAGILIERRQGLTLVGIGINCAPLGVAGSRADPQLLQRAVSLEELGATVSRPDVACRLLGCMSRWLANSDRDAIRDRFVLHDAMVGTVRTIEHGRVRYRGLVEAIDPLSTITIKTPSGSRTLPIAQTTHVREDEPFDTPKPG